MKNKLRRHLHYRQRVGCYSWQSLPFLSVQQTSFGGHARYSLPLQQRAQVIEAIRSRWLIQPVLAEDAVSSDGEPHCYLLANRRQNRHLLLLADLELGYQLLDQDAQPIKHSLFQAQPLMQWLWILLEG